MHWEEDSLHLQAHCDDGHKDLKRADARPQKGESKAPLGLTTCSVLRTHLGDSLTIFEEIQK